MRQPRLIGILLIALGVLFLIARAGVGDVWPLFIVLPGIAMLAVALVGPTDTAGFAVPGSIVSTVGLILLTQAATGRFDTWSYAWGLVIAAVGAGTFVKASIEDDADEQREGMRLAIVGLAMFAAFGAFFELFVFGGLMTGALGWILPLALIAAGAWMLRRQRRT